jgi:protein gp37
MTNIPNRSHIPTKDPNEHGISWTSKTWNVTHGCSKISEGCLHCYACQMALRQQGIGNTGYENGFAPTERPDRLNQPYSWKRPSLIFTVSMGDLFHKDITDAHILKTVAVMAATPHHRYQVLTKRPERLVQMDISWPENVWVGTSVENSTVMHRIQLLRQVRASVRWLSVEPLIGPLENFDPAGLDWIVVGGESAPKPRPINPDWVRAIRDACLRTGTPFHFKQWGGRKKKDAGRVLDGRTWDEMPLAYGAWQQANARSAA